MIADTKYDDLIGTASANYPNDNSIHSLNDLATRIGLDSNKLELVGIKLNGDPALSWIYLICIDKLESDLNQKNYIIFSIPKSQKINLSYLLSKIEIVLYDRFDTTHRLVETDSIKQVVWSDYMAKDEEE